MRKVTGIFGVLLIVLTANVFGDSEILKKSDQYYNAGRHEEGKDFLEKSLPSINDPKEKFEILWRLARLTMEYGNLKEDQDLEKDKLLAIFKQGADYADQAIKIDPDNPKGYFWKSSNLGRWGETNGILDSLSMAKEMRTLLIKSTNMDPLFSLSWHVLGMLYERVPGIISFGDVDMAVSFGRKAVALQEAEIKGSPDTVLHYNYYVQLARHLIKRDWSSSKRLKNQNKLKDIYNRSSDLFGKNSVYEAIVPLENISDREEAEKILTWAIGKINGIKNPTFPNKDDLSKALEIQAEL